MSRDVRMRSRWWYSSSVNKWVGDGRARTPDFQHCSLVARRGRMRSAASQWRGVYQLFIDCATAVWRQLCGVFV